MNHLLHIPGLVHVLQTVNANRLALAHQNLSPGVNRSEAEHLIETLFQPSLALAVYGTLAPGASNAAMMATIPGQWRTGRVRGHRYENSAGAAIGYPGMVWDMAASPHPVQLFQSTDLPQHWPRLDEFEGDGYVRILVPIEAPETMDGTRSENPPEIMPVEIPETTTIRLVAITNLYALRPNSIPQTS